MFIDIVQVYKDILLGRGELMCIDDVNKQAQDSFTREGRVYVY